MAILEHETIESSTGFAKKIEESAMTMMFDNLQKTQYNKPIQSTVREIACNGLDSHKERDAARDILAGRKKEEDYFIRREEALYKDSNFNKNYYSLDWLSTKTNIQITYFDNGTTGQKDSISFKDWGVGLGEKRLYNSLNLGWSSKRNSKLNIGKFGIGAKAPLSTGVPSYRLVSTYNGKKYILDIFSHKTDSAISKFNLDTGKKNKFETWIVGQEIDKNGKQKDILFDVYYEDTTEKNSVEIIVETKKHHKQQYIEAIKSQLLYLKGISFIVNSQGHPRTIDVTAPVLYEDDKVILSDSYQYSKPHILIDNVNYGYVDFQELELESKLGNIGIKVGANEVAVVPSREAVVWNEQTRETVVNRFKEVVNIATIEVSKSLKEKNFIEWLRKCASVISGANNSRSVVGRLSQVVDISNINPAFTGDPSIKYKTLTYFFNGFKVRKITEVYDKNSAKRVVKRVDVSAWSEIDFNRVYVQHERTSHRTDLYLHATQGNYNRDTVVIEPINVADLAVDKVKFTEAKRKALAKYQKALLKQLLTFNVYEKIAIPEDWTAKVDKLEDEEVVKVHLTPAELRKQNATTVYKKLERSNGWHRAYNFSIREWKINAIPGFDEADAKELLVYGFGNPEDKGLLEFIANFAHDFTTQDSCTFISISKQNEFHYKDLKKSIYVKDLFKQLDSKTGELKMHPIIKKYNTVRLILKDYKKLAFLYKYQDIDFKIHEKYTKLRKYSSDFNEFTGFDRDVRTQIDDYLSKLVEFQLFQIEAGDNKKLIAKKSKELFGVESLQATEALDLDMYDLHKELVSYVEPLHVMLNVTLKNTNGSPNDELITEIKNYVNYKLNL